MYQTGQGPLKPTKGQALGVAVGTAVTVLLIPLCGLFGLSSWVYFFVAGLILGLPIVVIYGAVYLVKNNRDQRLVETARARRYYGNVEPEYGVASRPTTPGNGYIGLDFGPKPTPPESM